MSMTCTRSRDPTSRATNHMPKKTNLAPSMALLLIFLLCLNLNAEAEATVASGRDHFVLVHGSGHGAWCWFKIVKLLRSSGHRVTAVDLAASGIDPAQPNSLRSISEYFKPLRDVMEGLGSRERVVLVGHSLGGLALSQMMEKFPGKIRVAVFVSAMMPGPKLNVSVVNQEALRTTPPLLDCRYTYDNGPGNPPTTFIFGPRFLASNVYQRSPTEDWTLANLLIRPLHLFDNEDMSREIRLSKRNYGSVKRVFVVSEEDKLTPKDLVLWMIKHNPPHETFEIKGSDHMVMLSKPTHLWSLLEKIVIKHR